MRTAIELGPKGKKHVAYAIDWPGLERNGKTPEAAFEHMSSYLERYAVIAERAGFAKEFAAVTEPEISVEYEGTGSTDFWGISFAHGPNDHEPMADEELERHLALLKASWDEFDEIGQRVSPQMERGPRGGGRDRDEIVAHLVYAELTWLKKLDIRPEFKEIFPLEKRKIHHQGVIDELRRRHLEQLPVKAKGGPPWTVRFTIRHLAYHVLDHAWEMEDKDLTGKEPQS